MHRLSGIVANPLARMRGSDKLQGILLLLKGIAALGDDAFIGAAQGLCKLAKVNSFPT